MKLTREQARSLLARSVVAAEDPRTPHPIERLLERPPGQFSAAADRLARASGQATLPDMKDEQRQALSGTSYVEQNSVTSALSRGLRKNPEVAQKSGFSAESLGNLPGLRGDMVRLQQGAAHLKQQGTDLRLIAAGLMAGVRTRLYAFRDRHLASGDEAHKLRIRGAFADPEKTAEKWKDYKQEEGEKTKAQTAAYNEGFAAVQAQAILDDTVATIGRGERPSAEAMARAVHVYLEQQEKEKSTPDKRGSKR
jgi:hypothetical protein